MSVGLDDNKTRIRTMMHHSLFCAFCCDFDDARVSDIRDGIEIDTFSVSNSSRDRDDTETSLGLDTIPIY